MLLEFISLGNLYGVSKTQELSWYTDPFQFSKSSSSFSSSSSHTYLIQEFDIFTSLARPENYEKWVSVWECEEKQNVFAFLSAERESETELLRSLPEKCNQVKGSREKPLKHDPRIIHVANTKFHIIIILSNSVSKWAHMRVMCLVACVPLPSPSHRFIYSTFLFIHFTRIDHRLSLHEEEWGYAKFKRIQALVGELQVWD